MIFLRLWHVSQDTKVHLEIKYFPGVIFWYQNFEIDCLCFKIIVFCNLLLGYNPFQWISRKCSLRNGKVRLKLSRYRSQNHCLSFNSDLCEQPCYDCFYHFHLKFLMKHTYPTYDGNIQYCDKNKICWAHWLKFASIELLIQNDNAVHVNPFRIASSSYLKLHNSLLFPSQTVAFPKWLSLNSPTKMFCLQSKGFDWVTFHV